MPSSRACASWWPGARPADGERVALLRLAAALRSGLPPGAGRRVLVPGPRVRGAEGPRSDHPRQAPAPGALRVGKERVLPAALGGGRRVARLAEEPGRSRAIPGRP